MFRYSVDASRFAVDSLDNETIIMDLVEGKLYLFEAGAAVFLEHLLGGEDLKQLELNVEKLYGHDALMSFRNFLQGLVEKGILREVPLNNNDEEFRSVIEWPESLGEIVTSEYDDMSSIITMDPIHDVDSRRGWPFEGTP